MAPTKVAASFKFDPEFHATLNRLAQATGTSKTQALEDSAMLAFALTEAGKQAHRDLREIAARYGSDARIVIGVEEQDGQPVAGLTINGKRVEDVRPRAYVDGDQVHVFLDVLGDYPDEAALMKVGGEVLLIAPPRFTAGSLPWPPQPRLGIVMNLADYRG